jgi:HK97 gp10 family phage protein
VGAYDFKTTSFEFRGFKELYRALDALPEVVKKNELEPLLVKALEPMRDMARRLAPDDPLTGPPWNLPTSIEVSARQRSGRAKGDRELGRFDARAYMGPTKFGYPQAMMQEFGTRKMVATPYMRPAWDNGKEGALEILRSGLKARLEMIIRKHGV